MVIALCVVGYLVAGILAGRVGIWLSPMDNTVEDIFPLVFFWPLFLAAGVVIGALVFPIWAVCRLAGGR